MTRKTKADRLAEARLAHRKARRAEAQKLRRLAARSMRDHGSAAQEDSSDEDSSTASAASAFPAPPPAAFADLRAETHGDFAETARIAQGIKALMASGPNWEMLPDAMREALESDAVKTARLLCGSWTHKDHIDDKIGYCRLALTSIDAALGQGGAR